MQTIKTIPKALIDKIRVCPRVAICPFIFVLSFASTEIPAQQPPQYRASERIISIYAYAPSQRVDTTTFRSIAISDYYVQGVEPSTEGRVSLPLGRLAQEIQTVGLGLGIGYFSSGLGIGLEGAIYGAGLGSLTLSELAPYINFRLLSLQNGRLGLYPYIKGGKSWLYADLGRADFFPGYKAPLILEGSTEQILNSIETNDYLAITSHTLFWESGLQIFYQLSPNLNALLTVGYRSLEYTNLVLEIDDTWGGENLRVSLRGPAFIERTSPREGPYQQIEDDSFWVSSSGLYFSFGLGLSIDLNAHHNSVSGSAKGPAAPAQPATAPSSAESSAPAGQ